MDEEILLIVTMQIMVITIGVSVKLYLLSQKASRIIIDRDLLIAEGYLSRPN
ncbi:MAG: hypothetical protein KA149_02850 [Chitinophagales bacterium]|nr:hypothetical protein [Chitinophagales bacterium]